MNCLISLVIFAWSLYNISMENIRELDTNSHSVYMLHYHLIMCIKYRKRVIDDEISERLKEIFLYNAPSYHILFKVQPNMKIAMERNVLVAKLLFD